MNDAIRALQLWGEYAPKFLLTLETDAEATEVCALHEAEHRFVPIARGTDPALVMIEACERLSGMTPGDVVHLEIADLIYDDHGKSQPLISVVDHPGTLAMIPIPENSQEFLRMWRLEHDQVITFLRVDAANAKIPDPYDWGCLLHDAAKNVACAYSGHKNSRGERLPYQQLLGRIVEGFNAEHEAPTTDVDTQSKRPS